MVGRPVAVAGFLLAAAGLLLLTQLPVDGSYAVNVLPALVLSSLGMGAVFMPLTLIATTGLENEDQGLASGLFNTSQQIGGALGLAILSTLAATRTSHQLDALGHSPSFSERSSALISGYHLAFLVGGGLMAIAVVLLATLIRRRDVEQIQAEEPVLLAA